ncbi:YidH family protein [Picrophilus oshimae]|uniref:Putative membrane protein n=1 Tax=Picrophilus torridus (strain ATCC 700027 / DSM 9790 / JCM 10055 / NBRC 100828 / KAW 2/3) TaxID=1122961 RepID=A0A8G2FXG6_PICTO|nr:DUF202 domain-containing protein [Picrophilus oshimae]SMD31282.1 putative membrane protein [Picrophilus oshimae DSM 9789]
MSPSDHLANKRTFLSWVRTGIALMGFGFVIAKFEIFIHILIKSSISKSSIIPGEIMIVIGIITIIYGLYEYLQNEKDLNENNYNSRNLESIVFSFAIIAMAIVLLLLII